MLAFLSNSFLDSPLFQAPECGSSFGPTPSSEAGLLACIIPRTASGLECWAPTLPTRQGLLPCSALSNSLPPQIGIRIPQRWDSNSYNPEYFLEMNRSLRIIMQLTFPPNVLCSGLEFHTSVSRQKNTFLV